MTEMQPLIEGKTKIVFAVPGADYVRIVSKDDITAGDGARRATIPGKAKHATETTGRVFELLDACGIPVAYLQQESDTEFIALKCTMVPFEVVGRRLALGSYLKRNPRAERGQCFRTLVAEFFLKTTGRQFKGIQLPTDDPLIKTFDAKGLTVVRPDQPDDQDPILIPADKVLENCTNVYGLFAEMERLLRKVFLVLESAWGVQKCRLADIKIEFGYTASGQLVVADVIDNDSWRLLDEFGRHLDKQRYRAGDDLSVIAGLYEDVATRSVSFRALRQKPTIILWRASEKDDIKPFEDELRRLGDPAQLVCPVASVHKQPEASLRELRSEITKAHNDAVIIVCVGLSNGAGPVFAADTHLPVIAVPATASSFPDDVWSSLRMASNVPMPVILSPANAIQAALGIFSAKNPHAYLARRTVVENAGFERWNSPALGKRA